MLVLRIDFEYDKEIAKSVTIKQAKKDRDRYLNNMRNNELFKTVVGYIWKLEDGEQRGLHYQIIFCLDGSHSHKDSYRAEEYSGPSFQDSKLRWYPAKKGAGNDGSKAKEFYGWIEG